LKDSDVDHDISCRKFLNSIFNSHCYSHSRGKFKLTGLLLFQQMTRGDVWILKVFKVHRNFTVILLICTCE